MNVLYLLVPLAIALAAAAVAAFRWAVRDGQFDDVETPAVRVLFDDPEPSVFPPAANSPDHVPPADAPDRHV